MILRYGRMDDEMKEFNGSQSFSYFSKLGNKQT